MDTPLEILQVIDKLTNEVLDMSKITLKKVQHMYSNTKEEIWRVFYGDEVIKRNNNLVATYKCANCARSNIVALNNVVRKMNHDIRECNNCKNANEGKTAQQSKFMKEHGTKIQAGERFKVVEEKLKEHVLGRLQKDQLAFNDMDDDFKDQYFQKHLTVEEYDRIKDKIKGFHNKKFTDASKFQYFPCSKVGNQTMYSPCLYDAERDVVEKPTYITFECESCGDEFTNRDLYIQKNKYKVLCKECNFCNNTFKIRQFKNVIGENIQYQSQLEKRFIESCNDMGVRVINGPKVTYVMNGKERVYRVDFEIPSMNMLLEAKDNRVWHREQVTNGKWKLKEDAALKYCKENGKRFVMFYPKTYMSIIDMIKKANKI